jgi:hypothetical protein
MSIWESNLSAARFVRKASLQKLHTVATGRRFIVTRYNFGPFFAVFCIGDPVLYFAKFALRNIGSCICLTMLLTLSGIEGFPFLDFFCYYT